MMKFNKKILTVKLEMKNLGVTNVILGIKISTTSDRLVLS